MATVGSMSFVGNDRGVRACFSCTGAATGNVIRGGGVRGRGLGFHRATGFFGSCLGLSTGIGLVARAVGGHPASNNCCVGPLMNLCNFPENRSLSRCGGGFRIFSPTHGVGMRG